MCMIPLSERLGSKPKVFYECFLEEVSGAKE